MRRAKLPFSVYKRAIRRRNHFIYYVKFRNEIGAYQTAVSSGVTSRTHATNWAYAQIQEGKHLSRGGKIPTFAEAAAGFWDYKTSSYVAGRLTRGKSFS